MPLGTTIKNTMVTAGSGSVGKVQLLSYNIGSAIYTNIGAPVSCTWGTASNGSISIGTDVEFSVSSGVIVHTVVIITSAGTGLSGNIAAASIDQINGYLGHAAFSSTYTFSNNGTFVLDNLTLSLT